MIQETEFSGFSNHVMHVFANFSSLNKYSFQNSFFPSKLLFEAQPFPDCFLIFA